MTMLKIPDLGGSSQVEIIEITVKEGDSVAVEQTVLVLETDKATMEIPADQAGVIQKLLVQVGDKVNSGDAIAELMGATSEAQPEVASVTPSTVTTEPVVETVVAEVLQESAEESMLVPDLGSPDEVPVIEILVKVGEHIEAEQTIAVLESSKATMEIPAERAGTVVSLAIKVGDQVKTGSVLGVLKPDAVSVAAAAVNTVASVPSQQASPEPQVAKSIPVASPALSGVTTAPNAIENNANASVHAGPAVRKLARDLGVDLAYVTGTGRRGRIQKEDVHAYVKNRMQAPVQAAASIGLPQVPAIDFSQFGAISEQPLNNVKRATARAMTTALLNVPQVTQFDLADITELEAYRVKQNERFAKQGIKFSLVPFVLKALARCLQDFPTFNASLSPDGEKLILKHYVHLGVAVETPKGLLVPVLRDVDTQSITEITKLLQEKATIAREGKLSLADMQGSSMSLSSLGGIGGTAFTPIVNPPEVAILGLSKASMQPVWNGKEFIPRLMLPLSLSYDHRVIDGAEAARFTQRLASYLQDFRDILM